jgi:hypothetical protein
MNAKRLPLLPLILILLVIFSACNFPTMNNAANQQDDQNTENVPPPSDDDTNNTQDQPPPPPEPEPQPAEPTLPEFNLAEPCAILSPELVETFLGPEAQPVEGPGTCVLTTDGMKSITVGVLQGETAKLSMINEIIQLENDCSFGFSYSSDQPDPTPIPAEAEYLLDESIPDLMQQSLALKDSCGMGGFETLPEYGPNVYVSPFELFVPGGLASIAGEDFTLTVLFADMEKDSAASVEVAKQILEMLLAGK